MKVLLLAAGRSKRMKPVDDKNFLDFLGKPLLQHQLKMVIRNGFEDIIIVCGAHNFEKISELGKKLSPGIKICEQKDLDLGMAGAVISAKEFIGDDSVLVFSGNDVVDDEAFSAIKEASDGDAESYILAKKVTEYFPGGYLEIDETGFIKDIVEKPEPGKEPSDLINLVVHVHKNPKKLVEYLESIKSEKDDKYEVALAKMIQDGTKIKSVPYEGFWQPIKFPWHINNVFKYFFSKAEKGIKKSAQIADSAVIKGDVIIGENVKVFEGAVINGPCYIGDNCVVANNALVRDSHVGKNCVIGFSTEIARSYLGSDVWTHSNYVGDSIIGNNVSLGGGTKTGNLRLDEANIEVDYDGKKIDTGSNKFGAIIGDNVRVGINTSLMPGVRIGEGSFIGAGLVISENIPENSFVRGTFELKISENKVKISKDRAEFKNKL